MFFLLQIAKPKLRTSDCQRASWLASYASPLGKLGDEIFLVF